MRLTDEAITRIGMSMRPDNPDWLRDLIETIWQECQSYYASLTLEKGMEEVAQWLAMKYPYRLNDLGQALNWYGLNEQEQFEVLKDANQILSRIIKNLEVIQ